MISSQAHDLATALAKSLGLDDQRSAETCPTNGCEPLDGSSDRKFAHLKIRVHLHDDKELPFTPGVEAAEPPIDADPRQAVHEVGRSSDERRAAVRRLLCTVAFGVITAVMVGAAFAWHRQSRDMVRVTSPSESSPPVVRANFWPSNSNVAAELAAKTSDRIWTQDTVLLQAAPFLTPGQAFDRVPAQHSVMPVLPPDQVSVAPATSPELQQQIEAIVSDVAVVRQTVERIAAVQEQMALDIATLQKSGQKASLPPQSPPVPASSRKHAPNIARSDAMAHSHPAVVPTAAPTPLAFH